MMLRHIGKEDLTVHSFKDRAAEKAGVAPEVAGAPPTHTVAAYQCADLSEMRRILTNERGRSCETSTIVLRWATQGCVA
jgi:hypothetical protein